MTDKYPMALYPPKGEMLIVNDEREHADAVASWAPVAVEPVAPVAPVESVAEPVEIDDEPETFDETGAPIKRGPGRPRKVVP